jgi:hypothetical protein
MGTHPSKVQGKRKHKETQPKGKKKVNNQQKKKEEKTLCK